MSRLSMLAVALAALISLSAVAPVSTTRPDTRQRLLKHLRSVPAIDTHDHPWPFDKLPGYVETERGKGMNLAGLWHNSYLRRVHSLTAWKPGGKFADWWSKAKHEFDDVRTVSFYRYQVIAFEDLY